MCCCLASLLLLRAAVLTTSSCTGARTLPLNLAAPSASTLDAVFAAAVVSTTTFVACSATAAGFSDCTMVLVVLEMSMGVSVAAVVKTSGAAAAGVRLQGAWVK